MGLSTFDAFKHLKAEGAIPLKERLFSIAQIEGGAAILGFDPDKYAADLVADTIGRCGQ